MGGGVGGGKVKKVTGRFEKDLVRTMNPNPHAHDVFGLLDKSAPAVDAPARGYSSIYPNGFPDSWGTPNPLPTNPLSNMQWMTPAQWRAGLGTDMSAPQLDNFMTSNSALAGLRGPSALAAGNFMSRLAALQGQNGGGNNGS